MTRPKSDNDQVMKEKQDTALISTLAFCRNIFNTYLHVRINPDKITPLPVPPDLLIRWR